MRKGLSAIGAGFLVFAAGSAHATVSLYVSDTPNGPVTLMTGGPSSIYSNINGVFYYNSKINGISIQVNAVGASTMSSPRLQTNSIDISSSTVGSRTLYIVQNMVSTPANSLLSSFTGDTIVGNGNSANLATYFSATNPFATGSLDATELAEITFTGTELTPQIVAASLNGITQPFYEVAKYTVNFQSAGTINSSINIDAGAVPEPATWAMMILGVGAIGFAMRRRKVAAQVSYAA